MSLELRNSLVAATKQRPSDTNAFRVLSYNILHSGYLRDVTRAIAKEVAQYNVPAEHLAAAHRCTLVREELEAYAAEIVLLQEFGASDGADGEEYANLRDHLEQKLGYKCEFFKKTGFSTEGVLIAYNKSRFTAVGDPKLVPLSATRLSDGKSGIINHKKVVLGDEVTALKIASSVLGVCLLRDNANPQRLLVVGNTHLYSSPDAHGARGIQALMASHALNEECQAASDLLANENQGLISIDRLVEPAVSAHLACALKTLGRHQLSKLQVRTIPYLLNETDVLRIGAAADLTNGVYLSGILPLLNSIANLAAPANEEGGEEEEEPCLLGVLIVEASLHAQLKNLLCRAIVELQKEVAAGDMVLPAISVRTLSDEADDDRQRPSSIIIGTASQVKDMCFEGQVSFADSLLFVSAAACGGGEQVLRETMEAVGELRKGCDSFTLLVDIDDSKALLAAKKQCFDADDFEAVCVRDNSDNAPKLLFGKGEGVAYSENYCEEDEGESEGAGGVFVVLGGNFNCVPGGHAHSATLNAAFGDRTFNRPSFRFNDVHAGHGDMAQYATTVTKSYAGIIDYIFYGCGEGDSVAKSLTLVSTVPMANIDVPPIPNEHFPSHHFAVIADLSF